MADVPQWAIDLVEEVCSERGVRTPKLQWWHRDPAYSSGHWRRREYRIHVTAGADQTDQRLVVLHELAHLLRDHRSKKHAAHDMRFWRIAFDLYEVYGISDYAVEREQESGFARRVMRERGLLSDVEAELGPPGLPDRTYDVDLATHRTRVVFD